MLFYFQLVRRWTPPVVSIEKEQQIAAQVSALGAHAIAKRLAPFPKSELIFTLIVCIATAALAFALETQAPLKRWWALVQGVLGLFALWGVAQCAIYVVMGTLNFGGAVNWLTRLQQLHHPKA